MQQQQSMMNITDLPNDLFLLIVSYLSPRDCVLARRVSKGFYDSFTEAELSRHLLVQHFPRAVEVREKEKYIQYGWPRLFANVASRYHYLHTGSPRSIEKLPIGKSFVKPDWARYYPVAPWQRHLQFEEKQAQFHYPDTLWTYDDGILLFPSLDRQSYALYDLDKRVVSEIKFGSQPKIIRRIRLCGRVLVVEWCEGEPYHQLNENEMVYRHFATAYDLVRDRSGESWTIDFRNEWKIHFLGMPLNSRDRFFSVHNSTHYALYLWQPNRSAWGEDEPIEALAIWDISSPSVYRPSEDSAGRMKPDEDVEGAKVIRRFSFSDLDFYKIRQRSNPTLRGLELDENHVYIIEEDHRWIVGQQAGHVLPRLHMVKAIGIPFGSGPRWEDECGADGDVNLSFCQRENVRRPNIAPCWRHEEFPYLTISEAVDFGAGVVFSARHCFMLETIFISITPKVHMTGPGYSICLKDDLWQQLLCKGKICGDERWLIGENAKEEVVILDFDRAFS